MNRLIKKLIAVSAAICCVVSMILVTAYADEQYTEGPLIYTIEDDGIIITGYFGDQRSIIIPDQIAGLPVFKIASNAFIHTTVKELVLPDTIMTIEQNAIAGDISVTYAKTDSELPSETEPSVQPSETEESSNTEQEATPSAETAINEINTQDSGYEDNFETETNESDFDSKPTKEEEQTPTSSPTQTDKSKQSEYSETVSTVENKGNKTVLYIGAGICLVILAGIFIITRKRGK